MQCGTTRLGMQVTLAELTCTFLHRPKLLLHSDTLVDQSGLLVATSALQPEHHLSSVYRLHLRNPCHGVRAAVYVMTGGNALYKMVARLTNTNSNLHIAGLNKNLYIAILQEVTGMVPAVFLQMWAVAMHEQGLLT